MTVNRVILSVLALALVSAPALAQDKGGAATPAPSASGNKSGTTGQGAAPIAAKVNLNTAPEADLGKLPKMTAAHSKAVVGERTKAKFKNWDDFVARKVVPADVSTAIKNSVTF